MADDEYVLGVGALLEEVVEVLERGGRGEGVGVEDLGLIAGLGADEGGGLEAALEGAGDDQVKVDVEGVENVGKLQAVTLAFLVEGAFDVEERVSSAGSRAGVSENK